METKLDITLNYNTTTKWLENCQIFWIFTRVANFAAVDRPSISRRHQDLLDVLRLGQLPRQCVLPPSSANHQHPFSHGTCEMGEWPFTTPHRLITQTGWNKRSSGEEALTFSKQLRSYIITLRWAQSGRTKTQSKMTSPLPGVEASMTLWKKTGGNILDLFSWLSTSLLHPGVDNSLSSNVLTVTMIRTLVTFVCHHVILSLKGSD